MSSRLHGTHEGQVGARTVCTESISPQGAMAGMAPRGGVIEDILSGLGMSSQGHPRSMVTPLAGRQLIQTLCGMEEGIVSGEAPQNTKEQSPTVHTAAAFLGNVCPLKMCVYRFARVPASLSSG